MGHTIEAEAERRHARYRAAAFLRVRPHVPAPNALRHVCVHTCAPRPAAKSGARSRYCKLFRVPGLYNIWMGITCNVTIAHMPPEITARKQRALGERIFLRPTKYLSLSLFFLETGNTDFRHVHTTIHSPLFSNARRGEESFDE